METLPHQEPVALIQCLGLKAGPLNRVIIAHMLCLQHPGTKQGWHRGHSRLTLRFLSTLTHTIRLTRDYLPRYKKKPICVLKELSQPSNSSASIFRDVKA